MSINVMQNWHGLIARLPVWPKRRNEAMNRQGRNMKKARNVTQNGDDSTLKDGSQKKWRLKKAPKRVLLGLLCIVVAAGITFGIGMWTSRYPDVINMGTACETGTMQQMNMCQTGKGASANIPITSLQAPQTAASVDEFTLNAQYAHLPFMSTTQADAWTFNGASPGPTLRVHQGDLVVVHLVNHLSVGVTIHWHGVAVPNSADG